VDLAGIHLPAAATVGGSVGVTFLAVQGFFLRLEKIQSRDNRRFVGRWLMGLTAPDEKWTGIVVELFHRLFGEHHWTVRCFLVSSVMTTITILAALFVVATITSDHGAAQFLSRLLGPFVYRYLPFACLFDFVSLFVTRQILYQTARASSRISIGAFVLADLGATTILFWSAATLAACLFLVALYGDMPWVSTVSKLRYVFPFAASEVTSNFTRPTGIFGALYAASLVTSAWLWAYLLVSQIVRWLSYLPASVQFLARVIDINEHPVRSIGTVIALISAGCVGLLHLL
jgi:hypothetical protein